MSLDPDVVRQLLVDARLDVVQQLSSLQGTFADIVAAATAVATDDEHDPDGATIAFERAQVGALTSLARARLSDIDIALERLAGGRYGICEQCGEPIAEARLAARPAARTCISCASKGSRG